MGQQDVADFAQLLDLGRGQLDDVTWEAARVQAERVVRFAERLAA
ncbi:hypothetical protein [Kibdelosporangium aridum]